LNAAKIAPTVFDFRDFGELPLDLDGVPAQDVPVITFDFKTFGDQSAPQTEGERIDLLEDPKKAVVFDYKSLVAPTIHVGFADEDEIDEANAESLLVRRQTFLRKFRSTALGRRMWRESIRVRWNSRRAARRGFAGTANFLELLWDNRPTRWPWRRILRSLPVRIFGAGVAIEFIVACIGIVTFPIYTANQVSFSSTCIIGICCLVSVLVILRQRRAIGNRVKTDSLQLSIGLFLTEWFWNFALGICGIPLRWNFKPDWSYLHKFWLLLVLQGPVTLLATVLAMFAYCQSSFYQRLTADSERKDQ